MSRPEPGVIDPEVAPHRPRRDRRRWCRGKMGVEHATEVALDAVGSYRRAINPRAKVCTWRNGWNWQGLGADTTLARHEDWIWDCAHVEVCMNCGKNLRGLAGTQCPDWKPR
jgi:hypothetical protein